MGTCMSVLSGDCSRPDCGGVADCREEEGDQMTVDRDLLDALYEMAESLGGQGWALGAVEKEALTVIGRQLGKRFIMGKAVEVQS